MTAHKRIHSSKSVEWYTPKQYITAARSVMGFIDLDPASCAEANKVVQAARYYTKEENGLSYQWRGRVWLNPPYGRGENNTSNQDIWSTKLLRSYEKEQVTQAILLVNATPDRSWFWPLWHYPVCFAYRRVRFQAPAGQDAKHSPTHGNAFVYMGPWEEQFHHVFSDFGHVVLP